MRRLISRTSITIDEAVAILLGRITDPIDFEPKDDSEEAETNCPVFCLYETLEDEHEVLEGEYLLAKNEKQPAHVVAEKLAALQQHEATMDQADLYRCAIDDELNKSEQSMLRVDRARFNAAYTYITRHSFNEWVKCRGMQGEQPDAVESAGSLPPIAEEAAKPTSRDLLIQQGDAILKEIGSQGHDPLALPKNRPGLPGVRFDVRKALKNSPLFKGETVFDKAWQKLRDDGLIVDKT